MMRLNKASLLVTVGTDPTCVLSTLLSDPYDLGENGNTYLLASKALSSHVCNLSCLNIR